VRGKEEDPIALRVTSAVYTATRHILDATAGKGDRQALGRSIAGRLRGTYGAELYDTAAKYPELNARDLASIVIAPAEYPWDMEAADTAQAVVEGARDRARAVREGPFTDWSDPSFVPPEEVPARVEEIRQMLRDMGRKA
jgi:hypothetical protein